MPQPFSLDPLPKGVPSFQHTFRIPREAENRIRRAMKLAGYTHFTTYAITSMIARAHQIERDHGIDPEGRPLPPKH